MIHCSNHDPLSCGKYFGSFVELEASDGEARARGHDTLNGEHLLGVRQSWRQKTLWSMSNGVVLQCEMPTNGMEEAQASLRATHSKEQEPRRCEEV